MIDLHMHSGYSEDGEYTPLELVEQCAKAGVYMMSVTDHNCVKANEEAQEAAKEKGILYIPGVEIDCAYRNVNFHVLGYGIDFRSGDFAEIENRIDEQSFEASLERLAKTQSLGFQHITENDMRALSKNNYCQRSWPGELFAEVLLAMPEYTNHPLLKPYRPGGKRSDNPYVNFYWDYYSQGKPCYVKTDYPKMEEMIEMLHRNHGVAVLAHPGINLKGREYMLEDILRMGFDGIEAFSSYHSAEQARKFYSEAQKCNLAVTCGSDYHGKTKPSIKIGRHSCSIPYPEMKADLERFFRNCR